MQATMQVAEGMMRTADWVAVEDAAALCPAATQSEAFGEIVAFHGLADLERLVPEWRRLLAQVPDATIFSTWEWLSPWWQTFGEAKELLALAYFGPGSALLGLAAFSIEEIRPPFGPRFRLLRLMGDGSTDSDNLDMLVIPGYERGFAAAVLDHLAQHRHLWDMAQLNTMPEDSRVGRLLRHELGARGWTHSCQQLRGTVIDLPNDWETYRARLSYNERGQLGKYARRLNKKYKVELRKCESEAELDSALEAFFSIHQTRWQAVGLPGTFADPERRDFYRHLSRLLAERGWLEFYLLYLDGRPVGGEFSFRYRDTVFCLQVGFDPAYSADRIGYVVRALLLEKYIGEGVRHYDFLFGEEGYKDRWAGRVQYYANVHFAYPWTRGSAHVWVADRRRRGKEWLRERLPKPAWNALHTLNLALHR